MTTTTRSHPSDRDSVDKLLHRLALLATHEVYTDGKLVVEQRESLLIYPSLARDFTCVAGCTACCLPFTIDYTPQEMRTHRESWDKETRERLDALFTERMVEVNGKRSKIYSYAQYLDDQCPFLQPVREQGALGCSLYPAQPLECASAPQLRMSTRGDKYATISKQPFGRAWAWNDTPQCEFSPSGPIPEADVDLSNEIGLLRRYKVWADLFQIKTVIPEVVKVLSHFRENLIETNGASIEIPLTK